MRQSQARSAIIAPQINNEKVSEILNSDLFSQFIKDGRISKNDGDKPLTKLDEFHIETFFHQINTVLEKFWEVSGDGGAEIQGQNGENALKYLLVIWDKCDKERRSKHFNIPSLMIANPSLLKNEHADVATSISTTINTLNEIATRYIDLDNHRSDAIGQSAEILEKRREAFSQILKICIEETVSETKKTKEGGMALSFLEKQRDYQTILLEISKSQLSRNPRSDQHQRQDEFANEGHGGGSIFLSNPNQNPSPDLSSPRIEESRRDRSPSPTACNGCNAQ